MMKNIRIALVFLCLTSCGDRNSNIYPKPTGFFDAVLNTKMNIYNKSFSETKKRLEEDLPSDVVTWNLVRGNPPNCDFTVISILCQSARASKWIVVYKHLPNPSETFCARIGERVSTQWRFVDVVDNEAVFENANGFFYYYPVMSEHSPGWVMYTKGILDAEYTFSRSAVQLELHREGENRDRAVTGTKHPATNP